MRQRSRRRLLWKSRPEEMEPLVDLAFVTHHTADYDDRGRKRAVISRRRFGLACSATLATLSAPAHLSAAPFSVTVGGYVFPPFVDLGANGSPIGLTIDLIEWLNEAQSDYRFSFF